VKIAFLRVLAAQIARCAREIAKIAQDAAETSGG